MTSEQENAWNPGLLSDIPQALWPQVTLFREENAYISYREAKELSDLTGINVLELASLRPARLVSHALLVRVTADLTVPDGPNYEDLGISLRAMVGTLQCNHIDPAMGQIETLIEEERLRASRFVLSTLDAGLPEPEKDSSSPNGKPSLLGRLFGKSTVSTKVEVELSDQEKDLELLSLWKQQINDTCEPLEVACFKHLIKVANTVIGHRGRLLPDQELITRVVVNQVINRRASELIDTVIEKLWPTVVEAEGYRELPVQNKPVVMNVKGASASGKSTIRPQQRKLAEKLAIPWEDFALISPDYWRKYLLDYESLGENYKYGAMLTGRELEIIDKKLDRYMARKAAAGTMSHLLIDRFRFDSFSVRKDNTGDSRLLSRFGDRVYLFFMVTHPAETVERAWKRGQKTGRYKAVDDLLFHNVEAFTGMPSLFLSWVLAEGKRIHFEFLDNDVPEGTLPRTAAFGWNDTLVVLDVLLLINIERYRKVNVVARDPETIFGPDDLSVSTNTGFITQCMNTVGTMVFADQVTLREYAILLAGKLVWWDDAYIANRLSDGALGITLKTCGYEGDPCTQDKPELSDASQAVANVENQIKFLVGHLNRVSVN